MKKNSSKLESQDVLVSAFLFVCRTNFLFNNRQWKKGELFTDVADSQKLQYLVSARRIQIVRYIDLYPVSLNEEKEVESKKVEEVEDVIRIEAEEVEETVRSSRRKRR